MKLDYCGNEIEVNLKVGEVVTIGNMDKEVLMTNWLMNGEEGVNLGIALENESYAYRLKDLEDLNVSSWLDVGFTQVGESDDYNTKVKIEYVSII